MRYFISLFVLATTLFVAGRTSSGAVDFEVTAKTVIVVDPVIGTTGFLDILFKNVSGQSQTISSFQFNVVLSGPDVEISNITNATASPYIFGSEGFAALFPPLATDNSPDPGFFVNDLSVNADGFVTIVHDQVVGLARIEFEFIATPTVPGLRPVTLDTAEFLDGRLEEDPSDPGNLILITDPIPLDLFAFASGGIDVRLSQVAVVPEPASLSMGLIGGCIALGRVAVRRRRKRQL